MKKIVKKIFILLVCLLVCLLVLLVSYMMIEKDIASILRERIYAGYTKKVQNEIYNIMSDIKLDVSDFEIINVEPISIVREDNTTTEYSYTKTGEVYISGGGKTIQEKNGINYSYKCKLNLLNNSGYKINGAVPQNGNIKVHKTIYNSGEGVTYNIDSNYTEEIENLEKYTIKDKESLSKDVLYNRNSNFSVRYSIKDKSEKNKLQISQEVCNDNIELEDYLYNDFLTNDICSSNYISFTLTAENSFLEEYIVKCNLNKYEKYLLSKYIDYKLYGTHYISGNFYKTIQKPDKIEFSEIKFEEVKF